MSDRSRGRAGFRAARLTTDEASAKRIAEALSEIVDLADTAIAAYEGTDGQWVVEVLLARPEDDDAIREAVASVADVAAAGMLVFAPLEDRDWVAAGMAALAPVAAGRFVVHGRHDRTRVARNRIGIEIEAAQAFGTGHHGTTRACLLALDAIARSRRPVRILDIGTGTGVLAIAAARTWRRYVLASDIDPRAVLAARQNARANRVGALVEVVHAAGAATRRLRERAPFGLVFANVLLTPLKSFAAPIARLLAADALVVLSGLLPGQANAALAAYRMQGLFLQRRINLDGWATLVLRSPKQRRRPGA